MTKKRSWEQTTPKQVFQTIQRMQCNAKQITAEEVGKMLESQLGREGEK